MSGPTPQRRFRGFAWLSMAVMIAGLAWSLREPKYPLDQYLSNLPTLALLVVLPFLWRRERLSDGSLLLVTLFTLMHVAGTRWLYSNVPYDAWCRELFGFELTESMGWRRNHYDRLVHLAYGLLLSPACAQFLERAGLSSRRGAWAVTVGLVFATSSLYEVMEWCVAVIAAPEAAERYNGQQGDPFDAQKDMALAGLGALVVWGAAALLGRLRPDSVD